MNILDIKREFPNLQFTGIMHVGAHAAEEWPYYKQCNIPNVVWVEAIPELVNHLNYMFKNTPNILVVEAAIFNEEKKLTFNISNNVCSSSLFDLKDHKNIHPNIFYNKTLDVETKRLDTLINNKIIDILKYNTLVVDVQGAELQVIESLGKYISNIDYILSEVSITELYEGTVTINNFDKKLNDLGFTKLKQILVTSAWGDAFYVRTSLLKNI